MQQLAATLTGISLGIFLLHLFMRNRTEACHEAGPVLIHVGAFRRGTAILMLLLVTLSMVNSTWDAFCTGRDCFAIFVLTMTWTFVVAGVFMNNSLRNTFRFSWIEFHEGGIVSNLMGQGTVITPWHRVAYCQWLDSAGTLSIYSFEPFKVVRSKRQAVTEVLLARTELRDPSGEVLNPDFVRPEAPPERAEPIRRPFQYEIKTLLLLMLFASAAFAWVGTVLHGQ